MEPRLSVITIAADDLPGILSFYKDVFDWDPVAANKDIIFYRLNGFLLSFCDSRMLTEFIGSGEDSRAKNFTISYNVATKEEVTAIYEQINSKVKILKPPTEPPFGGLFFYFEDIEGNVLEVACNDYVVLDKERNVIDHKSIDNL